MSIELAPTISGAHASRWKRYPAYRDSGVEWIGEVPEVWKVKKIMRMCLVKRGASPRPIDDPIYFDDDGEYSWVRISDVTASTKYLQTTEQKLSVLGKSKGVPLEPGELFLSIAGSVGKPILAAIKCCIHDGFVYFVGLEQNRDYMYYIFLSGELYKGLGKFGTQLNLNTDTVGDIKIPAPPLPEQRTIAAFLDRKTGRIDTLIEKKGRQVELLKEKRAALISHAVTKGLDPDVKMKDSGVEWLGEVPEKWEVIRVKLLEGNDTSVVQTGPFGAQLHASDYLDDGVPLILIRNVRDLKIDETDIPRISNEDAERLSMYRLNIGDIVFSRVGSIGRIALCTEREKGWLISGQMLRLRIQNPMLDSRFSLYAFSSKCLLTFVELQSVGSTRESINTDILRNMPIPIPPLPEQLTIAAFLDHETGRIDILTTKIRESISKLREYRTALISAAVTGKIDVREGV